MGKPTAHVAAPGISTSAHARQRITFMRRWLDDNDDPKSLGIMGVLLVPKQNNLDSLKIWTLEQPHENVDADCR